VCVCVCVCVSILVISKIVWIIGSSVRLSTKLIKEGRILEY